MYNPSDHSFLLLSPFSLSFQYAVCTVYEIFGDGIEVKYPMDDLLLDLTYRLPWWHMNTVEKCMISSTPDVVNGC